MYLILYFILNGKTKKFGVEELLKSQMQNNVSMDGSRGKILQQNCSVLQNIDQIERVAEF